MMVAVGCYKERGVVKVKKKRKPRWPRSVRILDYVGYGKWVDSKNQPVCAVGWMRHELGIGNPRSGAISEDHRADAFRAAYFRAANVILAYYSSTEVESINDGLGDFYRTLLYNAAWAILGYTKGQSKEVLRIAREARKLA